MQTPQAEMEAIVQSMPTLHALLNPETLEEELHLSYEAEIQYKRKPPSTRLILCGSVGDVLVGDPVMITYHCGMRSYQHSRHISVSSEHNCSGGFYYTDGTEA